MTMPFIDLAAQQKRLRGEIEARLNAVLDHGGYIMGAEVAELEAKGAAGARALPRVRVTQQRRHVRRAHAHHGVGEGGEARDDDEAHGIKGARHADRKAARRKVAADHRE